MAARPAGRARDTPGAAAPECKSPPNGGLQRIVVETKGIEPSTFAVRPRRSPS